MLDSRNHSQIWIEFCQLKDLLHEFSDVLSEISKKKTPDLVHRLVRLKSDEPARKKRYPIPYARRHYMQKGIDNLM